MILVQTFLFRFKFESEKLITLGVRLHQNEEENFFNRIVKSLTVRRRAGSVRTVSREGIRVWRARRCSIILILRFVVSTKPFLLVLSNFFCILLEIVSGSLHYFSFLDIFRKSQSKLKMSKQSKLNTRDIDRA